jgi:hypothetical protein
VRRDEAKRQRGANSLPASVGRLEI